MKGFFKDFASKAGVFLFGVLFLVAGALLIVFPKDALPYAVLAIGITTILYGVIEIVLTLSGKKKDVKYFVKLLCAAAALFCGIYLIVERNGDAVSILAFFIGAAIVLDGAFKLHAVVSEGKVDSATKWVVIVLSLVSVVGGFAIVKFPPENVKACSVIVGILTIIDGFMNVYSVFCRKTNGDKPKTEEKSPENAEKTVVADGDEKDGESDKNRKSD